MQPLTPAAVRIVDRIAPDLQGDVLVLGGCRSGVAAKIAPYVDRVRQICFDQADAREAQANFKELGAANILVDTHRPDQLPYPPSSFAAALCLDGSQRLAEVEPWLLELGRIMQPGGQLLLRSHLVPGSRLRGKKARLQREAGDYINAFCRLRSTAHRRYFSQDQWEDLLDAAAFHVQQVETAEATFDFSAWADECAPSPLDVLRLRAMLIQAPEKAYEFLTPRFSGDRIFFRLPEITILATAQANLDKHGQSERTANLTRQVD